MRQVKTLSDLQARDTLPEDLGQEKLGLMMEARAEFVRMFLEDMEKNPNLAKNCDKSTEAKKIPIRKGTGFVKKDARKRRMRCHGHLDGIFLPLIQTHSQAVVGQASRCPHCEDSGQHRGRPTSIWGNKTHRGSEQEDCFWTCPRC